MEGVFKHERDEQFDEYLKEIGLNMVARKMMASISPSLEITRSGDYFEILIKTKVKNNTIKFTLGKEFTETTPINDQTMTVGLVWET